MTEKLRYKCKLYNFRAVGPGRFIAQIQRLEPHKLLGEPRMVNICFGNHLQFTTTSLVTRIDLEKREFETLNSIYWYD
jgi:hypothetical protein